MNFTSLSTLHSPLLLLQVHRAMENFSPFESFAHKLSHAHTYKYFQLNFSLCVFFCHEIGWHFDLKRIQIIHGIWKMCRDRLLNFELFAAYQEFMNVRSVFVPFVYFVWWVKRYQLHTATQFSFFILLLHFIHCMNGMNEELWVIKSMYCECQEWEKFQNFDIYMRWIKSHRKRQANYIISYRIHIVINAISRTQTRHVVVYCCCCLRASLSLSPYVCMLCMFVPVCYTSAPV